MIETLDYSKVPAQFAHCLNENCKQAEHCLRYQTARHIPDTQREIRVLHRAWTRPEGNCPEFKSDVPVKYAYGWTHMFDHLIHEKAVAIKQELLSHYGKAMFYRLKRMEKGFSPKEQQYVRNVFLRHGVKEEPIYDAYCDQYTW